MCGVAGVFAYHHAAPAVDVAQLRRMRDAMIGRGPDGCGLWVPADRRAGLGHRRLKIIDLSNAGAQPMVSSCGRYVISYNGEIYNYRSLRRRLRALGHCFQSDSDTEVLLAAFAQFGCAMFAQLRGMYAFALWDIQSHRMLLARDPHGIKPLYYADDGWTCRVASQVKALRASGAISNDPEAAGQVGFLLFGSVPEPFTLWREIRAVPAGHYLWVDDLGPACPQPYTSFASHFGRIASQNLAEALRDSVRHHLVADVPVGAFLSAGIDSSVLVALMSELSSQPVRTVTVGFDEFADSEQDERPLARQVARLYGTEHCEYTVSRAEFERDLPTILAAMDQPSIDGINTWLVSKAVAAAGLKVAVSGLGGDELFGGYPSFVDIPRWHRRARALAWIPGLGRALRYALGPLLQTLGVNAKAAGLMEYGGSFAGCYLLKRGLFMPWELPALLGTEVTRAGLHRLRPLLRLQRSVAGIGDTRSRISVLEQSWYMRNQLLRDTDWASMSHSVEVRVPLVDWQLHAAVASLQASKSDLAQVPKLALPAAVVGRRKTGFTTPVGAWTLPDDSTAEGHWSRRWARQVEVACAYSH